MKNLKVIEKGLKHPRDNWRCQRSRLNFEPGAGEEIPHWKCGFGGYLHNNGKRRPSRDNVNTEKTKKLLQREESSRTDVRSLEAKRKGNFGELRVSHEIE